MSAARRVQKVVSRCTHPIATIVRKRHFVSHRTYELSMHQQRRRVQLQLRLGREGADAVRPYADKESDATSQAVNSIILGFDEGHFRGSLAPGVSLVLPDRGMAVDAEARGGNGVATAAAHDA